jgi:hypothetical protein
VICRAGRQDGLGLSAFAMRAHADHREPIAKAIRVGALIQPRVGASITPNVTHVSPPAMSARLTTLTVARSVDATLGRARPSG